MADPVPIHEGTITLADRRKLGYAAYGNDDGDTIFWFHGTPGARRQIAPDVNQVARDRNLRVIILERPGVGDSTNVLYDRVLDWATDVEQAADHFDVDRFAIAGLSGGGPYVLACAYAMPERVVAGAVLGGVAPTRGEDAAEGGLVSLATRFRRPLAMVRQPFGKVLWGAIRLLMPVSDQAVSAYVHFQPPGDKAAFELPGVKEMFVQDIQLGSKRQFSAVLNDVILFTKHWGFSPRDVDVPIRFWHGDEDHIVPLVHGHHVAKLMRDAKVTERPGESHLGALGCLEEILDTLLDLWPDHRP